MNRILRHKRNRRRSAALMALEPRIAFDAAAAETAEQLLG